MELASLWCFGFSVVCLNFRRIRHFKTSSNSLRSSSRAISSGIASSSALPNQSLQLHPHQSSAIRVAVAGAGVLGLSVALRLSEELSKSHPGSSITIIAESFLQQTTSYNCGGLWEPYQIPGTPEHLVNKWGAATFQHFLRLFRSSDAGRAGVQFLTAYNLFDETEEPFALPGWKDIVLGFKVLDHEALQAMLLPSKYTAGFCYETFVVDQKYYLQYITGLLRDRGVIFEQKKLHSLSELVDGGEYSVVVNCLGLGAGEVVDDPQTYPIRGQVLRVNAPHMKSAWTFGSNYIIPNVDNVVLGGTAQKNDWNVTNSLTDTESILSAVTSVFPSLSTAPVESVWTGLRPGRTSVRLDSQVVHTRSAAGVASVLLVHCYGHGGAGVTLSMGCAEDVVSNHIVPYLSQSSTSGGIL